MPELARLGARAEEGSLMDREQVPASELELSLSSELALSRLAAVDLNLLVPLLALLEERSVTHAAQRVGLSQPAMSHALRRLRRLLDDELLVRHGGAMILTPRAEEMLAPVRGAVERSAAILDPRPFDPASDRRQVTIALTTSAAVVYGPLLIAAFERRAPNVVLRFQTTGGQSTGVFSDRGVDAVLLTEGYASPYPRERLYDDRWVVLARAGGAGGEGGDDGPAGERDRRGALELIEQEPHIAFVGETGGLMRPYALLDERGVEYVVRTRVTDYLVVPHLVAAVGGVALHRAQVALKLRRTMALRALEFPFPAPGLGIDVVWNPLRGDGAFRAWLRDVLFEAAEPLRARQDRPL